jgi:hypothetical protein
MDQRLLSQLGGNEAIYPHAMEEQFPRVFNKLVDLFHTPQIHGFLNGLLIDNRSESRAGFPADVATEIFHLSNFLASSSLAGETDSALAEIPEHKRVALKQYGYDFTPNGLLKSVEDANLDAMKIFLSCGMNLEVRNERDWTPLMISAFNGQEAFASLLIKCGARLTTRDTDGYTPLHWASYNGFDNVVKLLLGQKADPNSRSELGWTALMQAATRGHLIICAYLIANGADVNLSSHDGWTALHKASNNGHLQVVKLLLDKRANKNAKYKDGKTPLDIATIEHQHEIIKLLMH